MALVATAPARTPAADHDEARHAVERGEARPLTDILAALRGKLPGEVIHVEIERHNGEWLYEFRTVDPQGRLFEVLVNARTGDIQEVKEK